MTKKDDIKQLLWHYQNLYQDTPLLVQYCAEAKSTLRDGFADVCDAIATLEKQLEEMD